MMTDHICNLCGETCSVRSGMGLENRAFTGEARGSYTSMALEDLTSYEFHLCEYCMDWLFRRFKTPPVVRNYHEEQPVPFLPIAELYVSGYRKDNTPIKQEFLKEFWKRTELRGEKINSEKYLDLYPEKYKDFLHHPGGYEFVASSWEYHIGDYVTVSDITNDEKKMYARVMLIKPGKDSSWSIVTLSKATATKFEDK